MSSSVPSQLSGSFPMTSPGLEFWPTCFSFMLFIQHFSITSPLTLQQLPRIISLNGLHFLHTDKCMMAATQFCLCFVFSLGRFTLSVFHLLFCSSSSPFLRKVLAQGFPRANRTPNTGSLHIEIATHWPSELSTFFYLPPPLAYQFNTVSLAEQA